jgi:preprotein translocase subunit SecA
MEAEKQCETDKEKVVSLGGLHIIGTERHESRRIDNQLRGRSGRQGDPGSSRFYLSLEDDLMRIFGSDRISGLMEKLGMDDDIPIENRMVSSAIENAQKRVESQNFDIRKHLLEYDDVMNKQRQEIYAYRKEILQSRDIKDKILSMIDDVTEDLISVHCPEDQNSEEWDIKALKDSLYGVFSVSIHEVPDNFSVFKDTILSEIHKAYEAKENEAGSEMLRYLERMMVLQVVDSQWKDHLLAMDHLKEGIGLRGYGQRDPLVEYKKEAFDIFAEMSGRISLEIITRLFKIQIQRTQEAEITRTRRTNLNYNRGDEVSSQQVIKGKKVGRNDPCPCGSGKKYKKCCGIND